jgi:signal transduction histidine kinase
MNSTLNEKLKNFEQKQLVASLLGLLILLFLSIVFNYMNLSGQAVQTAKFISRMIQVEDFREVGITLQEAKLDHFTTIKYISSDSRRSFTLPEISDLMPDHSFWKNISHDQMVVPVATITSSEDKIIFEFSRFNEIKWALLIWGILNLVSIPQTRFMKKKIVDSVDESLKIEAALARSDVAQKVRHNIRTPLSALIRLSGRESKSSSDDVLLSNVITQIKNLISDLDDKKKEAELSDGLFYPVLSDAMREVRLVAPSRLLVTTEVDDSLISATGQFVGHELRSIIANLTNNAFEATADGGRVDILAKDFGDRVLIDVKDNGKGVPQEILPHLTQKGFSYDKPTGTGLGLHHAKESLKCWDGSISITSRPGEGTTVQVMLPIRSREPWYVPRIRIRTHDTVLILDDQPTIHEVWKARLKESGLETSPFFFTAASDAHEFLKTSDTPNLVVFADYDLGSAKTGLDFLGALSFAKEKYLVTGHFDDKQIQSECKAQSVSLIPKTTLSDIPIAIV